ncbi:polymorphic toxin type 23 domain-containing protein [Chryseobacterium gallinarum]|uniref:Bacterial toxin 23 domain-containing protein n=1 Tax=Chryseobacterium gallinarum TaxID=1324352 RepID=A0ABX6KSQ7_CHRGL|nr:polymorphic toxin type 23 domain-containing protein [Chryseobacterium gallinarum]QIY91648.1 hypothetical protein FOB44_13745 [Chryseobacterium gallinarum]
MGAVGGAVTGLLNPGLFFAGGYSFLGQYAGGVISSIMPAWNINIGNFSFGISPSIAFGKGLGFGANVSATFQAGDFALSAGFGIMNYGAHAGSGESGWEFRKSLMAGTLGKEGNLGLMLGTNIWSGMYEQQTGIIRLASGDFSMTYENDGSPFDKKQVLGGILGDGSDRWRTAAMTIGIGDFSAGFNLFTGERNNYNGDEEKVGRLKTDNFGRRFPNGFVNENLDKPRYRMGALYVGWKNYRVGVDSEHVRHAIQDHAAHNFLGTKQPGFENLSWGWKPYFQYQTKNQFTSW